MNQPPFSPATSGPLTPPRCDLVSDSCSSPDWTPGILELGRNSRLACGPSCTRSLALRFLLYHGQGLGQFDIVLGSQSPSYWLKRMSPPAIGLGLCPVSRHWSPLCPFVLWGVLILEWPGLLPGPHFCFAPSREEQKYAVIEV
jgi:hypothetical protein